MRYRKMTFSLLLFLLGLVVMAVPSCQDEITREKNSKLLAQFHEYLKTADLETHRQLAAQYNEKLRQKEIQPAEEYEAALNIFDGVIGVLHIPSIRLELPVYHGVSEEVLAKGAGHMARSALPIGGEGNHTVLTGHTGLPGAELFTRLTELKEGDVFFLSVLDETLCYQVDQIKVVFPDDGKDLIPVPGKDYCTLVTCTPYGVNSHRLLVRGIRLEQQS